MLTGEREAQIKKLGHDIGKAQDAQVASSERYTRAPVPKSTTIHTMRAILSNIVFALVSTGRHAVLQ